MFSEELKQFVMTLVATTVSIVLTFGTTAIIDRHKKRADKRELVMMIMYDMQEATMTDRVDETAKTSRENSERKDRLERARKEGAASAGL